MSAENGSDGSAWFPSTPQDHIALIDALKAAQGLPEGEQENLDLMKAQFQAAVASPQGEAGRAILKAIAADRDKAGQVQPGDESSQVGWVSPDGNHRYDFFPNEERDRVGRVEVVRNTRHTGTCAQTDTGWKFTAVANSQPILVICLGKNSW